MGPLSDDDLDGLLRDLGLPSNARPLTPVAALLPKPAPLLGASTLKLAAACALGAVSGAFWATGLPESGALRDRQPVTPSLRSVDRFAPPPTELEPSLPRPVVGGASVFAHQGEAGPARAETATPEAPVPPVPSSVAAAPSVVELPEDEALPTPFRRASGAPPRVRMVAGVKTLGARGGAASGPLAAPEAGAYVLGALTVTGRLGPAAGNALVLGGTFDLGARVDPGGPRLSGALTGLAGLSRESGSHRLDLAWTLSGRVTADPSFARGHAPDGDHLSTGPLVALSLGEAGGARVQVGLSAQAPLEPGGWERPALGLSVGLDLAPRS